MTRTLALLVLAGCGSPGPGSDAGLDGGPAADGGPPRQVSSLSVDGLTHAVGLVQCFTGSQGHYWLTARDTSASAGYLSFEFGAAPDAGAHACAPSAGTAGLVYAGFSTSANAFTCADGGVVEVSFDRGDVIARLRSLRFVDSSSGLGLTLAGQIVCF